MSSDRSRAILETILTLPPSAESFSFILLLVKNCPIESTLARYINESLKSWKDEYRVLVIEPHEIFGVGATPGWEFVRCLEIREYDIDTLSHSLKTDAWNDVVTCLRESDEFGLITCLRLAPKLSPLPAYSAIRKRDIEELATVPLLQNLRHLEVSLTQEGAMRALPSLFSSSHFPHLSKLSLGGIDASVIETLDQEVANSLPVLRQFVVSNGQGDIPMAFGNSVNLAMQLTSLKITETPLYDKGVSRVLSNRWGKIKQFSLSGVGLTPAGLNAIERLACISALESLDLSWNELGTEGLSRLGSIPLSGLRGLNLAETAIRGNYESPADSMIGVWRHKNAFPSLTTLTLSCGVVSETGIEQLCECCFAESLAFIKVHSLTTAGFVRIMNGPFHHLQEVDASLVPENSGETNLLGKTFLPSVHPALKRLSIEFMNSNGPWLKNFVNGINAALTHLRLRHCKLSHEFDPSVSSPASTIRVLDIASNNLRNEVVEQIAKGELAASLVSLNLSHNSVPDACKTIRAHATRFQNLVRLDIHDCDIPLSDIEALSSHTGVPFVSCLH